MSSSDYTIVRRLRHMNKLPCNVTPTITHHQYHDHQNQHQYHQNQNQHQHHDHQYHQNQNQYNQNQHQHYDHQQQYHDHQYHQYHQHNDNSGNQCTNNCNIAPNSCTTIQPTICTDSNICTDNTVCYDDSTSNGKYITKTKVAYKIVPIKNGSAGVLVEPYLPFKTGDLISFHRKSDITNYFNGVVLNYDAETGFMSIGNFDNITGTFSESHEYIVNSILFDPETARLKQRMEWLFQKLYQVDLEIRPDFNPNDTITYVILEEYIYNLNNYLFDIDIRLKPGYALSNTFLSQCIDDIYYQLFEVTDLSSFNPNGSDVALTSVENKIYEIYIYLFSVDLAQNATYNPNATV